MTTRAGTQDRGAPACGRAQRRTSGGTAQRERPNTLPEEKPKPGWLRFVAEYRSYMQIILVAAAVVSLLLKEWSTAMLLIALTVLIRVRMVTGDDVITGAAIPLKGVTRNDHHI